MRALHDHPLHGTVHDGWTLDIEREEEADDRVQRWAYRARRAGLTVPLDWSGFAIFEARHFALMVDLGFPARATIGSIAPLRGDDIDRLAADHDALAAYQTSRSVAA